MSAKLDLILGAVRRNGDNFGRRCDSLSNGLTTAASVALRRGLRVRRTVGAYFAAVVILSVLGALALGLAVRSWFAGAGSLDPSSDAARALEEVTRAPTNDLERKVSDHG